MKDRPGRNRKIVVFLGLCLLLALALMPAIAQEVTPEPQPPVEQPTEVPTDVPTDLPTDPPPADVPPPVTEEPPVEEPPVDSGGTDSDAFFAPFAAPQVQPTAPPTTPVPHLTARGVTPIWIPGASNDAPKTCAYWFPGSMELRVVNDSAWGTVSGNGLTVNIVRPSTMYPLEPGSFDWTSNLPILGIVVKNGDDGANFYNYTAYPALYPPGPTWDNGLTNPDMPPSGPKDTFSHINFCFAPVVVVSKTASASFTRTYSWTIDKTTDGSFTGFAGDSFPAHPYSVTVNRSESDTPAALTGVITISNPSSLTATVTGVVDTPSIGGPVTLGAPCNSVPFNIGPNSSVQCSYSAPLGAQVAGTTGTNTVAVSTSGGVGGNSASANFTVAMVPSGFASVNVTDTNPGAGPWFATDDAAWNYTRVFQCPTDTSLYNSSGVYQNSFTNTATITETGQSDTATVNLTCYLWDVSKTANGTYQPQYRWDIDKIVTPEIQSGFAGDTLNWTWSIRWWSSFVANVNHAVSGVITITNPAPMPLTVAVADQLTGGFAAAVDCDPVAEGNQTSLTVLASSTGTCSYSAAPGSQLADNTATATRNSVSVSDTVLVPWSAGAPIGLDATISDSNHVVIPVDAPQPYSYPGSYTCSEMESLYAGDGNYTGFADNTATISWTGGSDSDPAHTSYTCYLPSISKTADADYDLTHTWDIFKTVTPANQSAFIGDPYSYNWLVTVTEVETPSDFTVSGVITVVNPNPEDDLVAGLGDGLSDFTQGVITADADCLYVSGTLTVPKGSTATCPYTATPADANATSNTATLMLSETLELEATESFGWVVHHLGPESVTLDDGQNPAFPVPLTSGGEFPYADGGACSTNVGDYTDGHLLVTDPNHATITAGEFSDFADATATVHCYLPSISKTAAGSYDLTHTWDIFKTVAPETQSAFIGDPYSYNWLVTVTEVETPSNYAVSGAITVVNPNPEDALVVALSDVLSDTTVGVIVECTDGTYDAGNLTVPAGGTAICQYSAAPTPAASSNTATIVLNTIEFSDTKSFTWVVHHLGPESVTLDDGQNPAFPVSLTSGGVFPYADGGACSTNVGDYTDGHLLVTDPNHATITADGFTDSADATATVDCYLPSISKTAAGSYDERHDWTITKSVSPTPQDQFAGLSVDYTWTVVVDETVYEGNLVVAGTITIGNPNPEDALTILNLTDVLGDGTGAVITACTGDADLTDGLTIAAGGSSVCNYTAENLPFLDTPDFVDPKPNLNTASFTLNGVTFNASAEIGWTPNVTDASVVIDDDQNPVDLPATVDGDITFTYGDSYTCSSDAALYAGDGMYTQIEPNTATLTSDNGAVESANADAVVNCYAPLIDKDAFASYDERYTWDLAKTVTGGAEGFAGENIPYQWLLSWTRSGPVQEGFEVHGTITVDNPSPLPMTVSLTDTLSDGTPVTILADEDCDLGFSIMAIGVPYTLTIPADSTATCGYTAVPLYSDPLVNTATVTLNDIPFSDTADVVFALDDEFDETAVITDPSQEFTSGVVSGDGSQTFDEHFSCSTIAADYVNGVDDSYFDENAADLLGSSGFTAAAYEDHAATCYAPVISKTGAGVYGERHEWNVEKSVNVPDPTAYIGQNIPIDWTVVVTETVYEENFVVTGSIDVTNPHPAEAMTVLLSDLLDNGGAPVISAACTNGGAYDSAAGTLTIPAATTTSCAYTSSLAGLTDVDNAPALNTATVNLNGLIQTATADIGWTPTITGASADLTDLQGPLDQTLTGGDTFSYSTFYPCSSDESVYAPDGIITDSEYNRADLTWGATGSDFAEATADVTCYAPVVSKTAAGTYDIRYDWDVQKTGDPDQSGFIGDTLFYDWLVTWTKSGPFEQGHEIHGVISVANPGDEVISVDVADTITGLTVVIDCGGGDGDTTLDVPAAVGIVPGSASCNYRAGAANQDATQNNALVSFGDFDFPASDPIEWTLDRTIDDTVTLTDLGQPGFPRDVSDTGSVTLYEDYTCSKNLGQYTGTSYAFHDANTVDLDGELASGSATADHDITCYLPSISKTAAGTYDVTHTWTIDKSVDPLAQNAFIGDVVNYNWTVALTETLHEGNLDVAGAITVTNPNPEDALVVTLSDLINTVPPTAAGITGCTGTGVTLVAGVLTVPGGGTAVCSYTANNLPFADAVDVVDPKPDTNTATIRYTYGEGPTDYVDFSGDATIVWTPNPINPMVDVVDANVPELGQNDISDPADYLNGEHTDTFICSTDKALYVDNNGTSYTTVIPNRAVLRDSITEAVLAGDGDATRVTCWLPTITKDAAGTYDERHEWTVVKTVDPLSQSAFAGETVYFDWTITVSEEVFEEHFDVAGTIIISNPNPEDALVVPLTDELFASGFDATINPDADCALVAGTLTIPAGGTATCGYTANPLGRTDTYNDATIVVNNVQFTAHQPFTWTPNVIRGSAVLDDEQYPYSDQPVTDDWTSTYSDSYTCSTLDTDYSGGADLDNQVSNTAIVYSGGAEEGRLTATTEIDCYLPSISKTAAGAYDERHEWTVDKTVTPETNTGLPGDVLGWTWSVTVSETVFEENFDVAGTITVVNPHPTADLVVALSDELDDATVAVIGACTDGLAESVETYSFVDGVLTVPGGKTAVCSYTAPDLGYADDALAPTENTATAKYNVGTVEVPILVTLTATDDIAWIPNPIRENATLTDDLAPLNQALTGHTQAGAYAFGPFTYSGSHTCSSSWAAYGDDGTYSDGLTNWAYVSSDGVEQDRDDAGTSWTCNAVTVRLLKLTNGIQDPDHLWTFTLTGAGVNLTDTTPPPLVDFGAPALRPGSYTICETNVGAGWTSKWWLDANNDGAFTDTPPTEVIIPFNPDAPSNQDLGNRCYTVTLTAPQLASFQVDNQYPGGDPRTPGYWKNWNSCTGGGQWETHFENGNITLDQVLASPGIIWDDILSDSLVVQIDNCGEAVAILDQRVVVPGTLGGKKLASDPARTLAMSLLAAQLNFGAGACTTQYVNDTALAAETLLDRINFDGTNPRAYLSRGADYTEALRLARILDDYNNGEYCGSLMP